MRARGRAPPRSRRELAPRSACSPIRVHYGALMTLHWAYLKRVLAGAIFGLYMAHLLYFLNPQVDVTPSLLAVVTLIYGAICGLLFGSVLWGLRALRVRLFGRPDANGPYRAHGFGFVVL